MAPQPQSILKSCLCVWVYWLWVLDSLSSVYVFWITSLLVISPINEEQSNPEGKEEGKAW